MADRPRVDAAAGEPVSPRDPADRLVRRGAGDLAAEAQAFLDAGVDGLITDHPGLLLAVRDQMD